MTASLAGPLADAIEAATTVQEIALGINREEGFDVFDPSAGQAAFVAAILGVLRADPAILEAVAEALYRVKFGGDIQEPNTPGCYESDNARYDAAVILDALLGRPE